jgi:hypothetical protein
MSLPYGQYHMYLEIWVGTLAFFLTMYLVTREYMWKNFFQCLTVFVLKSCRGIESSKIQKLF